MKKLVCFVLILISIASCDSTDAPDCFQRTGEIVRKEVAVTDFKRILVLPNVEVILKQGTQTSVIIESGSNLIDEVTAIVEGDRLILRNTNDCNLFRSFNQTKIFVTAPDIFQIRSATQFDISSDGILRYPVLSLISEDFIENNNGNTNGTFSLEVDSQRVAVVGNNIASFFLTGDTDLLSVNIASGTGRFEGANLVANNVEVQHRGTNKIIVNPIESLVGNIRSTGDVISVNRPPIVNVVEFFTGRLKFN